MPSTPSPSKFTVLLVEDSDDDTFFFLRATRQKTLFRVLRVSHGEEAKQYLQGVGKYADRELYPLPDAVLTDLKMPLCTGTELVMWLRRQPEFSELPAVVVSSSNVQADLMAAQAAGATAYLVKPSTLSGYEHLWDAFYRLCVHAREFSVSLPQE